MKDPCAQTVANYNAMEKRWYESQAQVAALLTERDTLREALADILDVAERARAGFPIESEEWYARRDFARVTLARAVLAAGTGEPPLTEPDQVGTGEGRGVAESQTAPSVGSSSGTLGDLDARAQRPTNSGSVSGEDTAAPEET